MAKHHLKERGTYIFIGIIYLYTFMILSLIHVIIAGIPSIDGYLLFLLLISSIFGVVQAYLYFEAIKITDISLSIPMLSLSPVFLILTSFFILGESPNIYGTLGILLIVVGSYTLNLTGGTSHALQPFKELISNKGMSYMLLFSIVGSVDINLIKIIVLNSDPIFGISIRLLLVGLFYLLLARGLGNDILREFRKNNGYFLVTPIIFSLSIISLCSALTYGIVPYVISIKRISIILSVLYGYLFFRERNIKNRFVGSVLMFLGIVMIGIYGR